MNTTINVDIDVHDVINSLHHKDKEVLILDIFGREGYLNDYIDQISSTDKRDMIREHGSTLIEYFSDDELISELQDRGYNIVDSFQE